MKHEMTEWDKYYLSLYDLPPKTEPEFDKNIERGLIALLFFIAISGVGLVWFLVEWFKV